MASQLSTKEAEMGRYIYRQPQFEARQFSMEATEVVLFREIFGLACEKDVKNRTLHVEVNPKEKQKLIVPDGWWFVQDSYGLPRRNYVMSPEDFERTYAPDPNFHL